MADLITVRPKPCPTCPYRRDAPSGFWAAAEYERLPGFDGDVPEQLAAGAVGLFGCHQVDDKLCAGWVGCHDMYNNLAVRLNARKIDPAVYDYVSPVPLFSSGAEAAAHGMRDLADPAPEVDALQVDLLRKRARQRGESLGEIDPAKIAQLRARARARTKER